MSFLALVRTHQMLHGEHKLTCLFSPLLQEGDPTPKAPKPGSVAPAAMTGDATGLGIGVYAFVLIGGAAAYFAYNYLQAQQQAQQGA